MLIEKSQNFKLEIEVTKSSDLIDISLRSLLILKLFKKVLTNCYLARFKANEINF